jgi:hypothetical protein
LAHSAAGGEGTCQAFASPSVEDRRRVSRQRCQRIGSGRGLLSLDRNGQRAVPIRRYSDHPMGSARRKLAALGNIVLAGRHGWQPLDWHHRWIDSLEGRRPVTLIRRIRRLLFMRCCRTRREGAGSIRIELQGATTSSAKWQTGNSPALEAKAGYRHPVSCLHSCKIPQDECGWAKRNHFFFRTALPQTAVSGLLEIALRTAVGRSRQPKVGRDEAGEGRRRTQAIGVTENPSRWPPNP